MVHKAIPQVTLEQEIIPLQSSAKCVYKRYEQMIFDSSSEYSTSSEFEFLSSTDPSEIGLSEREVKKRTDPAIWFRSRVPKHSSAECAISGTRPLAIRLVAFNRI